MHTFSYKFKCHFDILWPVYKYNFWHKNTTSVHFCKLENFFPYFCDFSRFTTCRNPVCMCYKWCLMSRNNGITLSKTASLLCSLSSVISSALQFLKTSKSPMLIIMVKCSTGTQKTTSTRWANAQTIHIHSNSLQSCPLLDQPLPMFGLLHATLQQKDCTCFSFLIRWTFDLEWR